MTQLLRRSVDTSEGPEVQRAAQLEALAYGTQMEAAFDLPSGYRLDFEAMFQRRLKQRDALSPRELTDAMMALGEEASTRLMWAYRHSAGENVVFVDPLEYVLLTGPQENRSVHPDTMLALASLPNNARYLIPGFYGRTLDGKIATLPFGGSDTTGAIVAVALGASEYRIYKDDVDGIYPVHPDLGLGARPVKRMTYSEAFEFACQAFDYRAVEPVERAGIPVVVRSTRGADLGTRVATSRDDIEQRPIIGITQGPDNIVLIGEGLRAPHVQSAASSALRAAGIDHAYGERGGIRCSYRLGRGDAQRATRSVYNAFFGTEMPRAA
jgi:aspartate kinase